MSFDISELPSVTEATTKPDGGVPESVLFAQGCPVTCGSGIGTRLECVSIAIEINTNNMGREKEGTDSGLLYGGGLACGHLYGQLVCIQRPDFMVSLLGRLLWRQQMWKEIHNRVHQESELLVVSIWQPIVH